MKKHIIYRSAIFAACILGTTICIGQNNPIFYGTNSNALNVVFIDTNLASSAKLAIIADLRICLKDWGKESERMGPAGNNNPEVVGYLSPLSRCPLYPDGLDFPKKLVDGPNGISLQVPQELSDAYTNVFTFVVANTNIVTAAYEFARFISSTNFNNIAPNQLSDYVHFNKLPPEGYLVGFSEIMSDLREQSYHLASVLSFHYSAEGPDNTNLWMYIPTSSQPSYSTELNWNTLPALWHNGKWKLCHWLEDVD